MKKIKLSRSGLELFIECPRCFYLKVKERISRPATPPYTLNLEVDKLLKKEFDQYRQQHRPHPTQIKHNLPHIPANPDSLEEWRNNFSGIKYELPDTNILLFGSIDDLWFNPRNKQYSVVDYKATSSQYSNLSKQRKEQYSRQLSFYAWLLSKNNLEMSDTSYILLYNAFSEEDSFQKSLNFTESLIPLKNNYSWIGDTLKSIQIILSSSDLPSSNSDCKYCSYFDKRKYTNQTNSLPF